MKKLKFLLIDDSPSTNFFNKVMIEKISVSEEIQNVENGAEALQVLNSYVPDLILLDINMPVMDGWEFLEEFQKSDARFKDVMIILMLGAELSENKKELIKTIPYIKGCAEKMLTQEAITDFVAKFHENILLNKCESVLGEI
ncbi:response regulator [Aquimarina sp. RZ0]|uniref:response regulator n=1 Tax=Aquimarina sp. RZ0 TaxID=2607730 RepID=UPI0011F3FFB0|nr:response regulator [Aquimarina sp. RZ0]KAA1243995.1 response regulator [Aquimarina sp. RZ0]